MATATSSTQPDVYNSFYLWLGQRYQLMLAKLQDFKTTLEYPFSVGMQTTLVSSGVAQAITSITSASTTATVTTSSAHGYSTNNVVTITGCSPSGYNGTFTITVLTTTTFTYTLLASVAGVAATTSAYYPNPPGFVKVEGMYITINSVNYPMQLKSSRLDWEKLNAIQIQAGAIPQFYFPRRDDFGIWPIPQTVMTGNISYRYRDRDLSVADYTTGTVTMTQYSYSVVGVGTTFTSAMVGRWLTITDPTIPGQGYWFRINNYIDATHITVDRQWPNATATTSSSLYRICEVPELPDEGHICLVDGVTADFYGMLRKDPENAALYENRFWTGDINNSRRDIGDPNISSGLIGLMNRYSDRDDAHIINKRPNLTPLSQKVFATSLTS